MNQLDRLDPLKRLLHELEISRATLKRYRAVPRDSMNVPMVYDRDSNSHSITSPGTGQATRLGARIASEGVQRPKNSVITPSRFSSSTAGNRC